MRDGPPPRSRSSPSTAAIEVPDMCEAISQHKRGRDVMQVDVLLARLAPIAGRHGVFTQSGHRRCACAHSTEAHFRRRALRRRLEDETPSPVVLAACCIVFLFCRSFAQFCLQAVPAMICLGLSTD